MTHKHMSIGYGLAEWKAPLAVDGDTGLVGARMLSSNKEPSTTFSPTSCKMRAPPPGTDQEPEDSNHPPWINMHTRHTRSCSPTAEQAKANACTSMPGKAQRANQDRLYQHEATPPQ